MELEAPPVTRRIVKPRNCAFVFGIPTSQEGFRVAEQGKSADFLKRFKGGWTQYYLQFVRDLESVEPLLRKWGVAVVHDATIGDFARLLVESYDVVILFSHWQGDAIEFRDGLAGTSALLAAIPPTFAGILDLCVCHPMSLVKELRNHRPGCIVKYLPSEAAPHYWLYFYRTLFSQLQNRNLSYLAAIEQVACAFLDSTLPAKGRKQCPT